MTGRGAGGNRGGQRPPGRGGTGRPQPPGSRASHGGARPGGRPQPPGSRQPAPPKRGGGLNLKRVGGDTFELTHPRCVHELEPDFEEGIELRQAGDPEGARDALRYALQGCGDNLWVHVALGRIALEDFNDPALARGHFGYAFELAQRAFPPDFRGRLVRDRTANRPYFDAIEGLAACYDALGNPEEAAPLRALAARLIAGAAADREPPDRRDETPSGPRN